MREKLAPIGFIIVLGGGLSQIVMGNFPLTVFVMLIGVMTCIYGLHSPEKIG